MDVILPKAGLSKAGEAKKGGRPTRREAAALSEKILDAATTLFLHRGFGATSIEAVAKRARISKRTFYHRFDDKAELYKAVIQRLLQRWLPRLEAELDAPLSLEELLTRLARRMLDVALSPDALALRRLLNAEAERFPELVEITMAQGARRGIERVAERLEKERAAGRVLVADCDFAAMQFQEMVLSIPLRRAQGFGKPLSEDERPAWAERCVALFLHGCQIPTAAP